MNFLEKYQSAIQLFLFENKLSQAPEELYQPMDYLLSLGGKRLRPLICLMACDLFNGELTRAIKPAIGIEYFHNFSLMHDDIMDQAPLRRNQQTVHIKYNLNTAILSGDALLIKSYQMLEDLEPELFKKCTVLFSKTAIQLCEGQQYDMNFETRDHVSYEEYIQMITGKTAVLCACALQIGAMIAKASEEDARNLYEFGKYLGIAFQLRDDYLDVFGNQELVGKKESGDIHENKKTILFISALEKANKKEREELEKWYSIKENHPEKVQRVYDIFRKLEVDRLCSYYVNKYHEKAKGHLRKINMPEVKKQPFYELMDYLLSRES